MCWEAGAEDGKDVLGEKNEKTILLINQLCKLPKETQWLEFKVNNSDHKTIAEDISALANSATICEKEKAYMIWGC